MSLAKLTQKSDNTEITIGYFGAVEGRALDMTACKKLYDKAISMEMEQPITKINTVTKKAVVFKPQAVVQLDATDENSIYRMQLTHVKTLSDIYTMHYQDGSKMANYVQPSTMWLLGPDNKVYIFDVSKGIEI